MVFQLQEYYHQQLVGLIDNRYSHAIDYPSHQLNYPVMRLSLVQILLSEVTRGEVYHYTAANEDYEDWDRQYDEQVESGCDVLLLSAHRDRGELLIAVKFWS